MSFVRSAVLTVCTLGVLGVGAPAGFAATPDTTYELTDTPAPNPQSTGRWGERHATAGDLNGDGVNDYWVGALSENAGPMDALNNAGRVYALSGKDRSVLYAINSPEPQAGAQFGFFIQSLDDVNGDGKQDIAIGTDAQDTTAAGAPCAPLAAGCNVDQGKAWVFSGAIPAAGSSPALLHALNNPAPQPSARFGSRIGRAGDLTGDGRAEVILGASNSDLPAGCGEVTPLPAGCRKNQGQAFIFNGSTGTLVEGAKGTLNMPASDTIPATCSTSCGSFGISVQSPGDTDGDKVPDLLVAAGSYGFDTTPNTPSTCGTPEPNDCNEGQGRMYVFSGATGTVRLIVDDPAPEPNVVFGFQDAAPLAPGDVNGDGSADFYGNGFQQPGPAGADAGRIWVFNGRTGAVLYEPKDPTPSRGGQFAFSLDKVDYNKDGTPDFYAGASPHHLPANDQSGGTYVFDGRDGSLLKSLELPFGLAQPGVAGDLGSNLGWSAISPGDLNGDGEPDFVAGATFQNVGANKDEGREFVFLSKVSPPPPDGGGGGGGGGQGQTPTPTPTPPARVQPNMVRPAVRAVQRGSLVVVRVNGRMTGVQGRPCGGRVKLGVRSANRRRAQRTARMGPNCRYKATLTYSAKRLPRRLRPRRRALIARVTARFQGNGGLTTDLSPTRRARVSR